MMTSPPDVQNVPDVWTLLDRVAALCRISPFNGVQPLQDLIDAALTQRDRFVLVPKELTRAMKEAGGDVEIPSDVDYYNVAIGSAFMQEVWDAMLAASPKPIRGTIERIKTSGPYKATFVEPTEKP